MSRDTTRDERRGTEALVLDAVVLGACIVGAVVVGATILFWTTGSLERRLDEAEVEERVRRADAA